MTRNDLAEIGKFLYGERWQSELANRLDVHNRNVRHWLAGTREIPYGVLEDIYNLAAEKLLERDGIDLILDFMVKESARPGQNKIEVLLSDDRSWSLETEIEIKERLVDQINHVFGEKNISDFTAQLMLTQKES